MELEQRYVVLKEKDIKKYLYNNQKDNLVDICGGINIEREAAGRGTLKCIVIEKDWPEYEVVLKLLSERVDNE